MKKVFRTIALVLVGVIVALFAMVQWIPSTFDRVEATDVENSNCWMADIPDEMPLSEIAIPGAHDYGSRNVQLALFSKCQDRNTRQLLEDGFRYLDIRLGVEASGDASSLSFYHGFTHCLEGNTIFSKYLYLEAVLKDCKEFLEENPSETILFVVKKEHGSETVQEFEELLHVAGKDLFLLTDTIPTMKEARGKIVLFRRYGDEAKLGADSGIYLSWSQQKDNSDVSLTYETCKEETFTAFVQDRYKFDTEDKWNAFMATIEETDDLLNEGVVINFLSTNGANAYGHPYRYAKALNQKFLKQDFSGKKLGWVILDFGNSELAKKVYESNF